MAAGEHPDNAELARRIQERGASSVMTATCSHGVAAESWIDFFAGELMNENVMKPGEHRRAEFPDGGRLLIHRLQGLELERAERIDLALSTPEGSPLVRFEDVPFDRDTGEVLAKYIVDHTY